MARYLWLIVLNTLLIILPPTISDDSVPIPKDKAQVQKWFEQNVAPFKSRSGTLDPELEAAEGKSRVIKVMKNGGGDFNTITAAVDSIPATNNERVIVSIGPGEYSEKVKMLKGKRFVTFLGDKANMPTMTFNGNAATYGTVESGTLTVDGDFFVAANLNIKNSSPKPDGVMKGAQAAAMRIGGDKSSFYNVKFYGFQDTFCDDRGKHFFKDCYIEGTTDFIFGNGKSIYLNTEIHCISGDPQAWIAAHARETQQMDTGYVFAHCPVTGSWQGAYLGRAWMPFSRVVYAYCELSPVNPKGWDSKNHPITNLFFGEIGNTGPGSDVAGREPYVKRLTEAEANPFLSLAYIEGSKWLLPPPTMDGNGPGMARALLSSSPISPSLASRPNPILDQLLPPGIVSNIHPLGRR